MIGDDEVYICLDCQRLFDEPKRHIERHGLDTPPYEEWNGCVYCGGAYAEAQTCNYCGDYIIGDYIKTADGYRYCEDCFTRMEIGDEDYV